MPNEDGSLNKHEAENLVSQLADYKDRLGQEQATTLKLSKELADLQTVFDTTRHERDKLKEEAIGHKDTAAKHAAAIQAGIEAVRSLSVALGGEDYAKELRRKELEAQKAKLEQDLKAFQ